MMYSLTLAALAGLSLAQVTQTSDGQPQAATYAAASSSVSQISDHQPQAATSAPVSQISDHQPQAATSAAVSQISDHQPQAATSAAISQISDHQPQAPTSAPAYTNATAVVTSVAGTGAASATYALHTGAANIYSAQFGLVAMAAGVAGLVVV